MWINRDFMVMGFSGDSMAGLLLAPHCLPHSFVFSFSVCSFAIFASIPIFRHNAKPAASLLFNRRHQSANAHNVQQTEDPLLLRSLFGHLLETHQQSVADVVLPIYGAHSGLLPGCFLPLRWRWEKMGKVPGRVEIHPENLLDFPANFMGWSCGFTGQVWWRSRPMSSFGCWKLLGFPFRSSLPFRSPPGEKGWRSWSFRTLFFGFHVRFRKRTVSRCFNKNLQPFLPSRNKKRGNGRSIVNGGF